MDRDNEKTILEQAERAPGGGRLRGLIDGDPRLRALIAGLNPAEARTLGGILSDPEKLRGVMSSPQAKKAMERLRSGKAGDAAPGGGPGGK